MARLNNADEHPVSLFPMFNILICTLGVFIFILSTLATISIGVGKSVVIIPETKNGETHNKIPVYIEWNGYDLVLHPSKETIRFAIDIRKIETYKKTYEYIDEKIKSTEFETLFNDLSRNKEKKYIILLIRPSGFDNLRDIRGYIENKGIDIGYEPINQLLNLRIR